MSIILNKKYINKFLENVDFEDFNQEYILCNNNPIIYDIVNKHCLKKSNSANILNKLIDFESKKKPIFNFDIIDKINYNKYEHQKLILKWMSYIENNITRNLTYYPQNIIFSGGCILNNDYNKIWSIISYLLKDNNKNNLIICDDYDINNILIFFKSNKININQINQINKTNYYTSFNLIPFSFFKQKEYHDITTYNWDHIFISDIHNFEFNNLTFNSKYKWCSSTPFKILNNKTFFKILNYLSNNNINQINYNILTYVTQVLFIYTEDNLSLNKNNNFNIYKNEVVFELNNFEKKFYKNLIGNNVDFDIIKKFTSLPDNNITYKSFNFNEKIKINNKNKCIICYTNKNNIKLGCNHEFCFNCIIKQVLIKPVCPLCRKVIKPENITIKQKKITSKKNNYLKYFIENNKKQKILIVTQFNETENNIIDFLNFKKARFISINKKFKKQSNNNIFLLNYNNINSLKELKNINYVLFFEPLYFSNYLRDKIESEIIGKININPKNNLKIITLGFKDTIDEKFLI